MTESVAKSPTVHSVDGRGYGYVENSDWWKQECSVLPCFAALWWPDYATHFVEAEIDGQKVVIQLWKGWCQKFLGLAEFPGGIGAEVGVYRKIRGRKLDRELSFLPVPMQAAVKAGARLAGDELWWPYPELKTSVRFELVNPETNETFFQAGPETTYWLCKWMDTSSYRAYKEDVGHKAPVFSAHYRLNYSVNGVERTW